MVTQNPLYSSGRAAFPHPVLTSGCNAQSPQRIGMTGKGWGQPAVNKPPHPLPEDSPLAAAPRQGAVPESTHLEPKHGQRWAIHGHSVVPDVSADHRAQLRALVNASTPPVQTTPDHSRSVWVASPSPHASFFNSLHLAGLSRHTKE